MTPDPKRLTDWELDQLRYSAEQRDIVDVAGKDLLALCDEVVDSRRTRTPQHPLAALLAFLPLAGLAAWLVTGEWRWAAAGVLALVAAAAVGAAVDGARLKRSRS